MFEFCLIALISVLFFALNVCMRGWVWIPRERTVTKLKRVENLWKLLITLYTWLLFGKAGYLEWRGIWEGNVNEEERSLFNGGLSEHMELLAKTSGSNKNGTLRL